MPSLLARFADNIFWLARYMERAENLARILDVTETFAGNRGGERNWGAIVEINSDEERFFDRFDEASAANVAFFYTIDLENPTSIVSTVSSARENARCLRHLISTEMWMHLNVFHNRLSGLTSRDITFVKLSKLCHDIKEACQAHAGITDGTLYRDQSWIFYNIGRFIERADQTSRLLDTEYRQAQIALADGEASDSTHWNALLRSAAGYHAFRRTHHLEFRPETVAAFLLFDHAFPRSIAFALDRTQDNLQILRDRHRVEAGDTVGGLLDDLCGNMQSSTIEDVLEQGLHQYIDDFQSRLIGFAEALSVRFFGYQKAA